MGFVHHHSPVDGVRHIRGHSTHCSYGLNHMSTMPFFAPTAMQTVYGEHFDYADILNQNINIVEVAHVLARNCRYNGHVEIIGTNDTVPNQIYSVGAHSCFVHDLMVQDRYDGEAIYGLLHDAGEAFITDLPRPLKGHLRNIMDLDKFMQMEQDVITAIYKKYHLPTPSNVIEKVVKFYDNVALVIERDFVQVRSTHEWGLPENAVRYYEAHPDLHYMAERYFDPHTDWKMEFIDRWNTDMALFAPNST